MDLRLLGSVLRRHSLLVIAGLGLAVALSVLSMARFSTNGLAYRGHEVWSSSALLLLTTQEGFPWGRSAGSTNNSGYPGLAALTDLYSQYATSDDVKRIMRQRGAPRTWTIKAVPVQAASPYSSAPPLISLIGTAYSEKEATKAAIAGTSALVSYLKARQSAAAIPVAQRVRIQILQSGTQPLLVQPRKKTLPIVVFLAILSLTLALAFVRENIRTRRVTEDGPASVTLAEAGATEAESAAARLAAGEDRRA